LKLHTEAHYNDSVYWQATSLQPHTSTTWYQVRMDRLCWLQVSSCGMHPKIHLLPKYALDATIHSVVQNFEFFQVLMVLLSILCPFGHKFAIVGSPPYCILFTCYFQVSWHFFLLARHINKQKITFFVWFCIVNLLLGTV
jgi:hypothetical protein